MAEGTDTPTSADELLEKLVERGVPAGLSLLEIRKARAHLRELDNYLQRMEVAVTREATAPRPAD